MSEIPYKEYTFAYFDNETNRRMFYYEKIFKDNKVEKLIYLVPKNKRDDVKDRISNYYPLNQLTIISGDCFINAYKELSFFLNWNYEENIKVYYQPEHQLDILPRDRFELGKNIIQELNGNKGIIFTNDEHYYNGLRVSVLKRQIKKENITFYHIGDDLIYNVDLSSSNSYPDGFFDQYIKEIKEITTLKRPKNAEQ